MPSTLIQFYADVDGRCPALAWLDGLVETDPKTYAKCLALLDALALHGNSLRRPIADILRDGIYVLRAKRGSTNYRILYFFSGRNVVTISHGLTKARIVPPSDIDLALERKRLVAARPDLHIYKESEEQ